VSLTSVVVATIILAIAVVTVVSRQNASGQEPTEQERSSTVAKKTKKKIVTVEVAGQQVQVDSETGQIEKLSPEDAQKMADGLRKLVNKSAEGLDEVHHDDGSVSIDLEDRFKNVTVAKVDEDGNLVTSCVDNPRAAGAFFGIDPKKIENESETPNRRAPRTPATNRN
jgi:hypothetical protein